MWLCNLATSGSHLGLSSYYSRQLSRGSSCVRLNSFEGSELKVIRFTETSGLKHGKHIWGTKLDLGPVGKLKLTMHVLFREFSYSLDPNHESGFIGGFGQTFDRLVQEWKANDRMDADKEYPLKEDMLMVNFAVDHSDLTEDVVYELDKRIPRPFVQPDLHWHNTFNFSYLIHLPVDNSPVLFEIGEEDGFTSKRFVGVSKNFEKWIVAKFLEKGLDLAKIKRPPGSPIAELYNRDGTMPFAPAWKSF